MDRHGIRAGTGRRGSRSPWSDRSPPHRARQFGRPADVPTSLGRSPTSRRHSGGRVARRATYNGDVSRRISPTAMSVLVVAIGLPMAIGLPRAARGLAADPGALITPGAESSSSSGPVRPPGAEELTASVVALTGPEMAGRGSGTPGGDRAARYLADRLASSGFRPGGDAGTFLQWFTVGRTARAGGGTGSPRARPRLDAPWRLARGRCHVRGGVRRLRAGGSGRGRGRLRRRDGQGRACARRRAARFGSRAVPPRE